MAAGASVTQRLPLVELKGPVFESDTIWQPGRSHQESAAAAAHGFPDGSSTGSRTFHQHNNAPNRARDLRQQQESQPVALASTPRLPPPHHQHQQLHREASQITMATVAMERHRLRRDKTGTAARAPIELDGRHLSAIGSRRGNSQQHQAASGSQLPSTAATDQQAPTQQSNGSSASPPPPPTTLTAAPAAAAAAHASAAAAVSSLPFVRRHLRRHRSLLELTLGQDRLVVDAFAEAPSSGDRLAARMRACAGEPTRGQASILQRRQRPAAEQQKQQQQQQQQGKPRRHLSRREKTAQSISRAILTYDRSL